MLKSISLNRNVRQLFSLPSRYVPLDFPITSILITPPMVLPETSDHLDQVQDRDDKGSSRRASDVHTCGSYCTKV